MQEYAKKPRGAVGVLMKGVLALLLAMACVPAEALISNRQAWGEGWGYAAYYGNEQEGYTLVLQSSPTPNEDYGQLFRCGNLDGDSFSVDPVLCKNIVEVVARDHISAPQDLQRCFYSMQRCTSVDLSGLDMSKVTDMSEMFSGCSSLQSVKLAGLDASWVRDMSNMFSGCSSLQSVKLAGLDAPRLRDMGNMFSGCSSLESVDLSGLDASAVTNTSSMFSGCSSLESADLSGLNMSKVRDAGCMFRGCDSLHRVVPPSQCSQRLLNEELGGPWKHTASGKVYRNIPEGLGGEYVFTDTEPVDPDNADFFFVIYEKAGRPGYDLVFQLQYQEDTRYGTMVAAYDPGSEIPERYQQKISSVVVRDPIEISGSMRWWFDEFTSCQSINLSGLKTSAVTDMSGMFLNCTSLKSVALSGLDTSAVTDMNGMFDGCSSLESVDLSGLDTSAVTDMRFMFSGCSSLESVDLSGLDTSRVRSMGFMFSGCSSLRTIDVSSFDTSQTAYMSFMFEGCSSLRTIDVSSFDTSKTISMGGMFRNSGVEELDLSNFSSEGLMIEDSDPDGECIRFMFDGCKNLRKLNISGFSSLPSNWNASYYDWFWCEGVFSNCPSLSHVVLPAQTSYALGQRLPEKTWTHESGRSFTPANFPKGLGGLYTAISSASSNPDNDPQRPSETPAKPTPGNPAGSTATPPAPSTAPSKATPTSLAKAQVTVSSKTYTGKTLKPSKVSVKVGGKTLAQGRDFTVSCKGGKAVGSYKVTVKGIGKYAGAKAATFNILPKGTSVKKAKAAKRGFTVTWKKPSKANLKQTTGYKVQWSTDKKFKKAVKSKLVKKNKTTSLKVSKLKGGKKYYVRVCAYKKVGGKYYYSSWSKAKAVKTKK